MPSIHFRQGPQSHTGTSRVSQQEIPSLKCRAKWTMTSPLIPSSNLTVHRNQLLTKRKVPQVFFPLCWDPDIVAKLNPPALVPVKPPRVWGVVGRASSPQLALVSVWGSRHPEFHLKMWLGEEGVPGVAPKQHPLPGQGGCNLSLWIEALGLDSASRAGFDFYPEMF